MEERTALADPVTVGPARGWFTTRAAGNLSHRRPHLPSQLARARAAVCAHMGLAVEDLHFMRQVHGAAVGVVDDSVVPGGELRDVDALVTSAPGRAVAVEVADCVPILLAGADGAVAAVHAGRRGLMAGVVEAALAAMAGRGAPPTTISAAIGPAIGGCCYEVPALLRDEFAERHPDAAAETTWGTPALDLPAAAAAVLEDSGATVVVIPAGCTRCDPDGRWFSHRADEAAGRQLGVVYRPREEVAP